MAAAANPQYLVAWTARTIRYLEVVPSVIMMYDYVLTLEDEIDFIWSKSMSVVAAIYVITRYIGTAVIVLSTTSKLWKTVKPL